MAKSVDSLAEFNRVLQAFTKEKTSEEILKLHKYLAMEALRRVVLKTPVDTGRARGNWQVSLLPTMAQVAFPTKSSKGKRLGKPGNAPASVPDISAVVSQGSKTISTLQPFSVVYLTNNVPYIERLEFEAWSKQAPQGMLMITLAELRQLFP